MSRGLGRGRGALAAAAVVAGPLLSADAASISEVWPKYGSTAGGTYLSIKGSGFAYPQEFNPWDSQRVSVGAVPCKIVPHYTTPTKIVCITGPSTLFENSGWVDVTVQRFSGLANVKYARAQNAFQYSVSDTPSLSWARSWSAVPGDELSFGGYYGEPFDSPEKIEIKVGDIRCITDREERPLSVRRRRNYEQKIVSCVLPDEDMVVPGHYNVSTRHLALDPYEGHCPNAPCFESEQKHGNAHGYGGGVVVAHAAGLGRDLLRHVFGGVSDLATGQPYWFSIAPLVSKVMPTEGGLYGGQNLTIDGRGFAEFPELNKVMVGDVPCVVHAASRTQLICRLGARKNMTVGDETVGSGTAANMHTLSGLRQITKVDLQKVIDFPMAYESPITLPVGGSEAVVRGWIDTDPIEDEAGEMFRETEGFFSPPLTAEYTFYIAGSDTMALDLGTNASNESLQRLAEVHKEVRFLQADTDVTPSIFFSDVAFRDVKVADMISDMAVEDMTGSNESETTVAPTVVQRFAQVSSATRLKAGVRYAFRLRHHGVEGTKWRWTRFAMKVSNLSSATTADGSALSDAAQAMLKRNHPAMETQLLEFFYPQGAQREIHYITIDSAEADGDFRLAVRSPSGASAVKRFTVAHVNASALAAWLQTASMIRIGDEPVRVHSCNNITGEMSSSTTYVITVNCPLEEGQTETMSLAIADSFNAEVRAGLVQSAGAPLGGTFKLGLNGHWSEPIDARVTDINTLTQQIWNGFRRAQRADVEEIEVEAWPAASGPPPGLEGWSVFLRVRKPAADVPDIEVNSSLVRGSGWNYTVQTVEEGDEDAAFLNRVDMSYFEMPPNNTEAYPVHVSSMGVAAIPEFTIHPGFTYKENVAPVLLSVDPINISAGVTLLYNIVQKYDSMVLLFIGDMECLDLANVSVSTTAEAIQKNMSCKVPPYIAGSHEVTVLDAQGMSDPARRPSLNYGVSLEETTRSPGSMAGGGIIEFVGDGVEGLNCSVVTLGGVPCEDYDSAGIPRELHLPPRNGTLYCVAPALASYDQTSTPTSANNVTVKMTQPAFSADEDRGHYEYNSSSTPYVQSITPTTGSAAMSHTIQLDGLRLQGPSGERPWVWFNSRECVIINVTDTTVFCFLMRSSPGPPLEAYQRPKVYVPGYGFAGVASGVELRYQFEIRSVSPTVASTAGGAIVTIEGAGFHPTLPAHQQVQFNLPDGTHIPCNVLSGNSTQITCELAGGVNSPNIVFRRLQEVQAGVDPADPMAGHDCTAGAADASKAHCFARSVLDSGLVRAAHGHEGGRHPLERQLSKLVAKKLPDHDDEDQFWNAVDSDFNSDLVGDIFADRRLNTAINSTMTTTTSSTATTTSRTATTTSKTSTTTTVTTTSTTLLRLGGNFSVFMNGATTVCKDTSIKGTVSDTACALELAHEDSPRVASISPTNGTYKLGTVVVITIEGSVSGVDPRRMNVSFGGIDCPVDDSSTQVEVKVPVCSMPAGSVPVMVKIVPAGYAQLASPYTRAEFVFSQMLMLQSISPTSGSAHGGTLLSLSGYGFGSDNTTNRVLVDGLPCEIATASNSDITCYAPSFPPANDPVSRRVSVDVLTPIEPEQWKLSDSFLTCQGSSFDKNDDLPAPEPEPEPEPEAEPLPLQSPQTEAEAIHFNLTGPGNLRLHKAACLAEDGAQVHADAPVPRFASRTGVTFKIGVSCGGLCAPLLVSYIDPRDESRHYTWCFNYYNSQMCDKSETVDEQVWHLRKFNVSDWLGKHGDAPQKLVLRLAVRAEGKSSTTFINEVQFEETSNAQTFEYGAQGQAPLLTGFSVSGNTMNLSGQRFGSSAGVVAIGNDPSAPDNFPCEPIAGWNDTDITCTTPMVPAGGYHVRVWVPSVGWSNRAMTSDSRTYYYNVTTELTNLSANGGVLKFSMQADIPDSDASGNDTSVTSVASGFGGEVELTFEGKGLGVAPPNMEITVCNEPCRIVEAVGTTRAKCISPVRRSSLLAAELPDVYPRETISNHAVRFYTDRGMSEGFIALEAFTSAIDRGTSLFYNGQWKSRDGCWLGFEIPLHKQARVMSIEYFPPTNMFERKRVEASVFEVRNLTWNSSWVQVASLVDAVNSGYTIAQGWNVFPIDPPVAAQAFRVRILPSACTQNQDLLRGIRFTGVVLDSDDSSSCPISLRRVSHPLATLSGVQMQVPFTVDHGVDRTPVVRSVSPNSGTARGGTVVEISGVNLDPVNAGGASLSSNEATRGVSVIFNTYPCNVTNVNGTVITCETGERINGIQPTSTRVWIEGRGLAVMNGSEFDTTFRYIDKWSNIYSWQDSEPPIDGDSVIVPEGQAILLDQDTPKMFFVLVSGYLEFDRKDLRFNATYLWISGGHFVVGTEKDPFLHQATLTLHGDRWNTIELPFIGSKMIAVTNQGGLHGGCHSEALRHNGEGSVPCPVRSVGKLDLHGAKGVSWTRIVQTSSEGSTYVVVEDAVNWPNGSRVLLTPSNKGHAEEVHEVAGLEDGGHKVLLKGTLKNYRSGAWYSHESFAERDPIDLRAAIGLLDRNILVQGDDASARPGNAFMFGAHMATFFGGEMRVENVEFFRTGQSANFGRYSSHWHNLSPGRTVDVADRAYLRNNSYHDTFQRAVVVHGTDYTVVRDNMAYRTKGHSFFTEAGDEHYSLFEHNLAVKPLPHPVLLEDDMTPAGFWLPGFTGWHRNNMAVLCDRGWRLQTLPGVGSQQSDLEFFNNSAHLCGFGWHLKPPHGPAVTNVFKDFTAYRCNTGMFYYGSRNIQHENHRLVECNTGHFQNHLSNTLHTEPFYTNLIVVGLLDTSTATPATKLAIRAPKDNEYFMVSGAIVLNLFDSPFITGCFDTMCTIRTERLQFIDSNVRTDTDTTLGGIIWDLDGTLTGFENGFVSQNFDFNLMPGVCSNTDVQHKNGMVCGTADGKTRVRVLYVDRQQPWQLNGRQLSVTTAYSSDNVQYDSKNIFGWAVPVVAGEEYVLRPSVANDFQRIRARYSGARGYVYEQHGWRHPDINTAEATPITENVGLTFPFSQWRDHFDADVGERVSRRPEFTDTFGTYSMQLKEDECDAFVNLTNDSRSKCGPWTNETGLYLKEQMADEPEVKEPDGVLRTVFTMPVEPDGSGGWAPKDGVSVPMGQQFIARECPVEGCPTPPPALSGPANRRLWSDKSRWPRQKLPKEWENVVIGFDEWVVLDIETPMLHWLTVEGVLEFSRNHTAILNAHSVKVWGRVDMGTEFSPIPRGSRAEIVLHGGEEDATVIMSEGFFLVNKVVAVLGNFTAFGTPRAPTAWTRLTTTANVGSTILKVQGDASGWPEGYEIGISATEFPMPPSTTETEVRRIVGAPAYIAASNVTTIRIDRPLQRRHFSGNVAAEAGGYWATTRLAAVVALLGGRSNVVLRSAGDETFHGGGLVIAGTADGEWQGFGELSDVDIVGFGKHYYQYPAVHFLFLERSIGANMPSRIRRCVFSESQAGAIELRGASDIEVLDNVFYKTYRTAVWVTSESVAKSITIRGNIAMETLRHPRDLGFFHPFAAFLLEVPVAELSGNVAAGSTGSGFVIRPSVGSCTANPPVLVEEQLNEAVACVTGFYYLRACQGDCEGCALVDGIVAWKNSHVGIITVDQSASMKVQSALMSDNHIGISLNFNRRGNDLLIRALYYNITVFGSTAASTCLSSSMCRAYSEDDQLAKYCGSVANATTLRTVILSEDGSTFTTIPSGATNFRRAGVLTHMVNNLPKLCESNAKVKVCKPPHTPVKACNLPWEGREGTQGSRYSEGHWDMVTFGHFVGSDCGWPSAAIVIHPDAVHAPIPQFFKNVRWLSTADVTGRMNMELNLFAEYDGTQHAFLSDLDGTLLGKEPGGSVLSRLSPELATADCITRPNYFECDKLKLRYLSWDAVASPAHRQLGAFKAWRESDERATWSRGAEPSICMTDKARGNERGWAIRPNDKYNLTLFAAPPKHHRFRWLHDEDEPIRLAVFLTQPFRMDIYIDGAKVGDEYETATDPAGARYPELTDPHGYWAFDPHQRRMYITLRGGTFKGVKATHGGGDLFVRLLQVVQLSLKLKIPVGDFDGPKLVQSIAVLLGIPARRIKIVSVQSRAQVAAAGGRRLAEETAIVIQVVEDAPPISPELLAEPTASQFAVTTTANGSSNATNFSTTLSNSDAEFSGADLQELQALAVVLQEKTNSGELAAAVGAEVVIEDISVSDPNISIVATSTTTALVTTTQTNTVTELGTTRTATVLDRALPPLAPTPAPTPSGDYIELHFKDAEYDKVDRNAFKAELLAALAIDDVHKQNLLIILFSGSVFAHLLGDAAAMAALRTLDLRTVTVMGFPAEVTHGWAPPPVPDPVGAGQQIAIVVGAAVGALAGGLTTGFGICWAKRRSQQRRAFLFATNPSEVED